ncbi:hypothetical protein PUN28_016648 [Cardiocondyla obscurior]|uniref:Uncharacterized protein n=1 Tax=Cardiocondyla obscurior TaxID=286306 RepID=A0AAW2ERU9_9HYME
MPYIRTYKLGFFEYRENVVYAREKDVSSEVGAEKSDILGEMRTLPRYRCISYTPTVFDTLCVLYFMHLRRGHGRKDVTDLVSELIYRHDYLTFHGPVEEERNRRLK